MFKQDLEAELDLFEHEVRLRRRGREVLPVEAEEARALLQQISLLKEGDEASRTTSRGLRGGCRGGGRDE